MRKMRFEAVAVWRSTTCLAFELEDFGLRGKKQLEISTKIWKQIRKASNPKAKRLYYIEYSRLEQFYRKLLQLFHNSIALIL